MRKAKELIGKSIVNQSTGERIASVHDLVFDTNAHAVAALLVDSGGWFRDARVVCWDTVTSISDVVMVQGEHPVITASSAPHLDEMLKRDIRLSGIPIVTETGERIGLVGDLYINDAGEVVGYEVNQGFMSGRKFLFTDQVQTVGRDALIADAGELTSVKQALQDLESAPQHRNTMETTAEPLAPTDDRLPGDERTV